MAFNFSGNVGVAGATITSHGSTTADGSGNYSATGVLNSGVNYLLTPTLALYNFSPSASFWPNVSQDLYGMSFTSDAIPNAAIVQKAVKINTTGGDTVSVTFAKNLTAGNGLIVAVMAVDTGAATVPTYSVTSGGQRAGTIFFDLVSNFWSIDINPNVQPYIAATSDVKDLQNFMGGLALPPAFSGGGTPSQRFSFVAQPLTNGGTIRSYAVIDGPSVSYGSRIARILLDSANDRWTARIDDSAVQLSNPADRSAAFEFHGGVGYS